MGKLLVNKIREINPQAKRGMLLLLVFLASFAYLLAPRHSEAAVVNETQWAIIGTTTTNTFPAMTLAKGTGTERLLVVQIAMDYSGNSTGATPTVTYGGQTLTQIVKSSVSQRQHIWLGRLNDAGIAAATGAPPSITVSWTGTAPQSGSSLAAAFYSGVNQTTPITASWVINAAAATNPPSSPINGISGGYAIYGVNTNATTAGDVSTPSGYTEHFDTANGALYKNTMGSKPLASTGTVDPIPVWTSVRYAFATATIAPFSVINTTATGTASAIASGKDRILVEGPYYDDADADNTFRVEYKLSGAGGYTLWQNMTHAGSPYSTVITGLAQDTLYDIQVTYQDPDGVTGTAVQTFTNIRTRAGGLVEAAQSWTRIINDTTTRATGAAADLTANFAVTAPAGTGRMLVVAITHYNTPATNVAPAIPSTITYGGTPLTLASSNRQTSAVAHTWLYYMKDNDVIMDGTSKPFALSWAAGIASTKLDVYYAVFANVDQLAPVVSYSRLYNTTSTTNMLLSPVLPIAANSLGIYVINDVNITTNGIPTWSPDTNWTTPYSDVAPSRFTGTLTATAAYAHELAQRAIPGTAITDSAMTGIRSLSGRYAMSAMALPPRAVTLTDGGTPSNSVIYAGQSAVVDAFTMDGSGTVTSIQVTGNANTTSSNISAIRIYRKGDANLVFYTPVVDELIGSGNFGAVGTTPVNIALTGTETISGQQNYLVVVDVAPGAIANGTSVTFTARVTGTTPAAGTLNDATAATLTLLPSLTVGNGVEPSAVRLWKSSAPTNLNAFTLNHNSVNAIDDDTISSITVTMTPPFISGGSGGTITKIKLVEITNQAGTVVYGSMNLPAVGDVWNIPVTGLVANATPTTYYVRIRTADVITPSASDPSGTLSGYYGPINGKVTNLIHSVGTNQLINNDTTSANLSIDVEKPNGPATASAATGVNPGEINLGWDPVDDTPANGGTMHPTTPVIIRRSLGGGVSPDPGCLGLTDGSIDLAGVGTVTINYAGRTVTDNGLTSDNPTNYKYRVCAKDSLGNISDGAQASANAKVQNICNRPPSVTLAYEDGGTTAGLQIIKSSVSAPFKLQVSNNDIGTCPDAVFNVELDLVVGNDSHFTKTIAGGPFPSSVTVGTGGSGASTGKTVNILITGIEAAGVQQLETYKFAVKLTNGNHNNGLPYTLTTPQVTGLLNDMPPIVHNSANMAKYQYGSWGQTYTCATCHSNSTTNIKGVYQIISTPIGKRNVVFTKTSSTSADSNGVLSNDLRSNKNGSNQVCNICHHQTRQHQYSASKPFGGPGNDEAYNSDHHNSRDCIRCHTHNSAFKSIYGLCGDCHGFKATGYSPINKATMVKDLTNALGPNPPNYGAHARHNGKAITCGACHSSTNHGLATTAWQGDGILEIGFNASKDTFSGWNPAVAVQGGKFYGTNNLNQPFSWVAGAFTNITTIADYNNSCSTYCHGGGSWKAGGNQGSNTVPNWVGAGQAACGTCHNATGAIPPTSGSHAKHAATTGAGLGIACGNCHSTYANYTGSAHINGKVEWGMAPYPGATYNGINSGLLATTGQPAPTPTGSYSSCTNLYCHSNVQGATGNGTGGPTQYATALWGGPADCGSCHGCSPQDPLCVAPQQSGSHVSHQNAQVNFDCHVCHDNGGTTSPLNHANSIINMQFDGLGMNTVYSRGTSITPGTAFGTCSTSDCHGRYTRAWGTAASALPMCEKCHGSATSPRGFYNTRGPTGTLSIYSTGIGVHDIHLQNLNSPRKATFARFTSFAVGMSCKQCHSNPSGPFTAGHIDNALPAEVPFNNNSSIAGHGKLFGYYSTPTYSFATQSCNNIYCHGAGMHSNRGQDEYAGTTPPAHSVPKWNVAFLTGNGAADCTKCHALPPPAPNSSYVHFGKTLNTCANCHQHVSADGYGFKEKSLHVNGIVEGGCDGCHGNPPINAVLGPPDGLTLPAQNAMPPGFAGSHNAHQLVPSIGNQCNTCHNGSSTSMLAEGYQLEIGFNQFGLGGSGTFTGYTNSVNGPNWKTTGTTTLVKSNVHEARCSNLYCHGGGSLASPVRPVLGGGNVLNPSWADALSIQCGDCHGVDSANAPTTGSHTRHALTVASLTCSSCHGDTTDNGTHVNAVLTWRLDRANLVFGPNATYNNVSSGSLPGMAPRGNVTAGDDYRTCNNVYCHSTVQSGDGTGLPTYIQPRWGAAPMTCGTCHNDFSTATGAASTGSHEKHANKTTGMDVPCGYCHQDAGASFNAMHADRSIFLNFTSYIGGAYSVGTPYLTGTQKIAQTQAFGSCSATFCHGTADSPVWGGASLNCNGCHSAKVDDVSWSGNHKIHYNYSTMPTSYTQTVQDLSSPTKYRFNCAHCHDDQVAKHSLKPANANAAARVFFGISTATPATSSRRGTYSYGAPSGSTDNGFNYTSGVCNASYCHSNGRGGAPFSASLTWTTGKQPTANCKLCHDMQYTNSTVSQLSGKHDKHMNPTNNPIIGVGNGFKCRDCHAPTITTFSNYTIANKGRHVNATLNYSGAKSGKNHNGITKICSNVYCHSNGNPNAVVFVNMTGFKEWRTTSAAITTCNNCHGRSNATGYPSYANGGGNTATSNLHEGHMVGLSSTTSCADCHRKTAETSVPNRFRPYSTTHLSGGPNVVFNTALPNIGSKAAVATAGFQVTCSNIICHGAGAPVWGAKKTGSLLAGQKTCTKCHGDATAADYLTNYSSATIAPGYGTAGTDTTMVNNAATLPRVGAHQRHLQTDMLSNAIKCGECHIPVTNVRNGSHWNMSTATLTFNGRAKNGIDNPYVSRTNGIMQCTNTYCHTGKNNTGTLMAPFWNMTGLVKENASTVGACNKCHAMAPLPGSISGHVALADGAALSTIVANCQSCHFNISSSATNMSNAFTDKNLHVNGVINYNLKCDSCHDYNVRNGNTWGILSMAGANTEGYGAHVKHIQYLQARYPTFSSLNPSTDNWANSHFIKICGACHSTSEAGAHSTSKNPNRRQITFPGTGSFGSAAFYNGSSLSSSAAKPKTCSNIDCHYRTSPIWSTY